MEEQPVMQLPLPSDQCLPGGSPRRSSSSSSQARFGNMSHHAFFTRHNPHPSRVRHIKGLLDHPICYVDDKDLIPTPRSFYAFPPNSYNESQLRAYRMPISAVNLGTGFMPVDTLTGLQRFTGLQNYPYKEKAVPHIGLVPITEGWREELRHLTRNIALGRNLMEPQPSHRGPPPSSPQRKTQYSATTGRIIPASRNGTGRAKRYQFGPEIDRMIEEADMETKVFQMICQLLQADDINSVKAWLMSAGDREKSIVTDLLHRALASQGDIPGQAGHWQYAPPRRVEEEDTRDEKHVERLTVADGHVSRERRPANDEGNFLPPIEQQNCQAAEDTRCRPATTHRLEVWSRQAHTKPKSRGQSRASARKQSCHVAAPETQTWKPSESMVQETD